MRNPQSAKPATDLISAPASDFEHLGGPLRILDTSTRAQFQATPIVAADVFLEVVSKGVGKGQKVGKLPEKISLGDLATLGHPKTPTKAIRAKCIDCSGGIVGEVRKCVVYRCALWPFRMGASAFRQKMVVLP